MANQSWSCLIGEMEIECVGSQIGLYLEHLARRALLHLLVVNLLNYTFIVLLAMLIWFSVTLCCFSFR